MAAFEIPEGLGEKMWKLMISLLEEQEGVKITCEIVEKEKAKEEPA